jgi:flagellar hook-length control protein FliK
VVITLSAYTQPPPVDTAAAVNELTQIRETNEIYEHDDEDSFAQMLAGMLHKTVEEEQSPAEETREIARETSREVSLDDFSGSQIDAAALIGEEFIFAEKPEAVIAQEVISESDFSEIELPDDYLSAMSNMEDMQINDQIAGEEIELAQEFFDAESTHFEDFSQETESLALGDANDSISVQQALLAKASAKAAAANGKEIKKDSAFSQTANIEASALNSRSEEAASLKKETGKEGRGRLADANGKNRRDKLSFEVRDMRSGGADNQNNTAQVKAGAQFVSERVQDAPIKEITLELKLPNQAQSTAQTAWETKAGGAALENMLARELHQNFNGDIVRHASMALHDGGEGVIKLALRPDSLGNVKIHLKMSENKITGNIIVESEEALNAFKKEIASLEQAFRESGFTNAELNLSLTADQRNTDWQEQKAPSFLPNVAASRYDESFERDSLPIADVYFGHRNGSVNMLA